MLEICERGYTHCSQFQHAYTEKFSVLEFFRDINSSGHDHEHQLRESGKTYLFLVNIL